MLFKKQTPNEVIIANQVARIKELTDERDSYRKSYDNQRRDHDDYRESLENDKMRLESENTGLKEKIIDLTDKYMRLLDHKGMFPASPDKESG
jgi:chromosome segregation ATPase